jgi:hypothetical protein
MLFAIIFAKFEFKIPLMRGEKKRQIVLRGKSNYCLKLIELRIILKIYPDFDYT